MAQRDFEEYFKAICQQYHQMLQEMKDFEEAFENNLVTPEQLEQMQQTIIPIKDSYMGLSYIKYLLDTPKRKSKKKNYARQNKKLLDNIDNKVYSNNVVSRNTTALSELHNTKKDSK